MAFRKQLSKLIATSANLINSRDLIAAIADHVDLAVKLDNTLKVGDVRRWLKAQTKSLDKREAKAAKANDTVTREVKAVKPMKPGKAERKAAKAERKALKRADKDSAAEGLTHIN